MQAIKKKASFDHGPWWRDACVCDALAPGAFRLDDGSEARTAASCLLRPEAGDRVLLASLPTGELFIVAVLERNGADAQLEVPCVDHLRMNAPRLTFAATETVDVQSLRDIELTAAAGRVNVNARHLVTTVTEALIENVRQYVGHMESYALKVKHLMRMHGNDALVTAERDVKVDAERISLG